MLENISLVTVCDITVLEQLQLYLATLTPLKDHCHMYFYLITVSFFPG